MIDKSIFTEQLRRAAQDLVDLPVSSGLLRFLAEELRKGEPPWWRHAAKAWEKRKFVHWAEAWGLFLTAIHYEALSDAQNPLVTYFPSCGGTAEADPATGLSQFLKDPPRGFLDNLKKGQRRVYIPSRSLLWPPAAQIFFQTRGLPYYMVEVNAAAGLNMAADLSRPAKGFDSSLIEARIGLDESPMDIDDINHRRWMTASFLPDQAAAIKDFDKDAELLSDLLAKDHELVQTFDCPPLEAAGFISDNVPSEEDVGLLVFNAATSGRMNDADYAKYQKAMFELMKPWKDRVLWLEIEAVRAEMFSTTFELRGWKIQNGAPAGQSLARFDFAARKTEYSREAFLRFLLPPGVQVPGAERKG